MVLFKYFKSTDTCERDSAMKVAIAGAGKLGMKVAEALLEEIIQLHS